MIYDALPGRPPGELGRGRKLRCCKRLRGEFMKYVFALMLLVSGLAHAISCTNLPEGDTALGYTTQVFYDQPQLTHVSTMQTHSTSKCNPSATSTPVSQNLAYI